MNNSFTNLLNPGEKIVWSAKPNLKYFIFGDSHAVIAVIGFALFFVFFGGDSGNVSELTLVAIAAGFILIVLALQIIQGKQTEYAITDQRVLIKTGLTGRAITRIAFRQILFTKVEADFIDQQLGTAPIGTIFLLVHDNIDQHNDKMKKSEHRLAGIIAPFEVMSLIEVPLKANKRS